MKAIEDRLRAAARAAGDTVADGSAPPLRLPARPRRSHGFPGWHPARPVPRWPAALAAAAAVIAVVGGAVALTGGPGAHHAPASGRGGCPAGASVTDSVTYSAGGRASGSIPPYYVALTGTRRPYLDNPDDAAVYSSATGAELARVTPPSPYRTFVAVSAAADDRTFALAAQDSTGLNPEPPVVFYLLRFNSGTHTARLIRIAGPQVPAGASYDGFALSPDGTKIAVAWEPNIKSSKITVRLQVYDLVSQTVRTWTSSRGDVAGDTADPWSLSWAADSQTLAINWFASPASRRSPVLGPGTGLRLLDTAAPGTSLVACSRLAVPYRGLERRTPAGPLSDIALLTPDGATVVAAVTEPGPLKKRSRLKTPGTVTAPGTATTPGKVIIPRNGPTRGPGMAGFAEFSARSGQVERVLDWRHVRGPQLGGPTDVLWSNPTGSVLVVYAPPGHWNRIGVLSGGRLTLLPQSARISFPAAAW